MPHRRDALFMIIRESTRLVREPRRCRSTQAAIYMQCAWRRLKFLRTVRRLVASVVSKVYDEHSQNYYYYNAQTGQTSWTKPV